MQLFFDVDYTLIAYNGSLRPLVHKVFGDLKSHIFKASTFTKLCFKSIVDAQSSFYVLIDNIIVEKCSNKWSFKQKSISFKSKSLESINVLIIVK